MHCFKSLFCVVLVLATCASQAQTNLYEADPSGDVGFTGTPNPNEFGQVFQLGSTNATITGFGLRILDFSFPINSAITHYTDFRIQVTFFSGFQSTYTGAGAEFNTPVETATFDLGAQSFQNQQAYDFRGTPGSPEFVLPTAISVPSGRIGAQFTMLGDTGSGLAPTQILSLYASVHAPLVGGNPFIDETGQQDIWFNENATDSSTSLPQTFRFQNGATQDLDVNLYGSATPEPGSVLLVGLGALALIARRRR